MSDVLSDVAGMVTIVAAPHSKCLKYMSQTKNYFVKFRRLVRNEHFSVEQKYSSKAYSVVGPLNFRESARYALKEIAIA